MKVLTHAGQEHLMPRTAANASEKSAELDVTRLYNEHASFIGRVILRLSGDGNHVDDLLQETFIIAFQKREHFDPSRAAAKTWLYGIASNLCKRHRRGLGRFHRLKSRVAQETVATPPRQPDGELERKQDVERVQSAIQRLAFKQREVFVLFEIENLGGREIAELLHIPVGTVWTRLHGARHRFRETLERQSREEKPEALR